MSTAIKKNILLLESVTEEALLILKEQFNVLVSESPFTGKSFAADHPIHGIVTRGKGDVSQELISMCPDLQAIARCGVGLDNIAADFARGRGVEVINAPGSNADTVAEHTLGLMLSLQRNLYNAVSAVKNNQWAFRNQYKGDEIRGKTLGILGMGNIGLRVAKLAVAFGMNVIYSGPHEKDLPYTFAPFNDVLETSDIITLHLPLNKNTHHLINENAFEKMQPHCLLVNTARGAVIDEKALTRFLENNLIGGFAADVLEQEPPPENSLLLKMPNVLITPHSASLTARTYNYMCVYTVGKLVDTLSQF